MAYKFQLGAARLSGSIQAEDGLVSTDVDDATAANIVAQIDNGEIAIAKLAANTISGKDLGTNLDALAVDDSSIEYSVGSAYNGSAASTIRVKASGITNAMLAGSIANDKLANSTISGVALGSNLNSLSKATNGGVNFSSYNGSAAVSNLQLDLSDLAAAAVNVGADSIAIVDADDDSSKKESIADLMTAVAGNGLAASSGVLAVGVDDSSIELNSDALRVKASGVTNAMLAGSIANAKLANSDVTIGSTAVALGGTQTSFSGLTGLDFTAASATIGASLGANNLTLGGAASTVIVAGNLTVQGTTTTVDSTTINVSSSFTFEGVADDFETTLGIVDPAADRTVLLPNANGVLAIFDPSLSDGELATALTAAPSEINLLDAITRGSILHGNSSGASARLAAGGANTVLSSDGTDISYTAVSNAMLAGSIADSKLNQITTAGKVALSAIELDGGTDIGAALVGSDLIMVDDGANGTMRKSTLSRLKTFIGSGTAAVNAIGDADANLQVGINAPSTTANDQRTWTLPASAGLSPGESIVIKAYSNSGAQPLTIAVNSGQEIDGVEANIVLESDNAAITLYYVAADTFIIV